MKHILFFALVSILVSARSGAETMRFVTPTDASRTKVIVEIVDDAYAQIDREIEIEYLPAKRSLLLAEKSEKYDGELVRIKDAQAILPNLIRVSVPISIVNIIALTVSSDFQINSIDELDFFKPAAIRGIYYTDQLFSGKNAIMVNNLEQGIKLLRTGRVDILLVPDLVVKDMELASNEIYSHDLPIPSLKLYHYINNRHQEIIPSLENALRLVTDNRFRIKGD